MRPDVVTFWHGPLDGLRLTCLRSQVAAGHKVTVYSFDPLPGLPDGVGNAEAEAILPHSFSERLRPPQPDGSWRDWTILQFSDFFRMRLMAERAGLWLDADVLLLKPIEIDPAKPYFAWERRRQLGNSVLYLPADDPIVRAFEDLMEQEDLTPDWLALRHRLTFMLRQLRHRSSRLSDIRVAIYGPAAHHRARAPRRMNCSTRCRSNPSTRSMPSRNCSSSRRIFRPARRSRDHRPAHLAKRPRRREADSRQPLCLGGGEVRQDSELPRRSFPSPLVGEGRRSEPLTSAFQFDPAQRRAHDLRSPWAITAPKGAVP